MSEKEVKGSVLDKKVGDIINDIKKVALLVGGVAVTGAAIYCITKVNAMDKALNGSLKDLSKGISVDVPSVMIQNATKQAVDKAVRTATDNVTNLVQADISREVKNAASDAVKNMYSTVKKNVVEEVAAKVSRLDISDLRAEVKDMAKDEIMNRLDLDLDDVLANYNRQLENVGKIYSGIADTIGKKA